VLEVSFTSGDKANIFLINERNVASDENFLDEVVSKLYKVLDSNDERTYVVNLEDKSITILDQSGSSIGVGYSEITTASEISGTINNRQQ
jgi:maltodextrin utilization protein YvdJ